VIDDNQTTGYSRDLKCRAISSKTCAKQQRYSLSYSLGEEVHCMSRQSSAQGLDCGLEIFQGCFAEGIRACGSLIRTTALGANYSRENSD